MELFILISCVLLLILNIILIGLHVRSRKDNTVRDVSRSISDLEKVIRDEPAITEKTTKTVPAKTGKNSPLPSTISGRNIGKP